METTWYADYARGEVFNSIEKHMDRIRDKAILHAKKGEFYIQEQTSIARIDEERMPIGEKMRIIFWAELKRPDGCGWKVLELWKPTEKMLKDAICKVMQEGMEGKIPNDIKIRKFRVYHYKVI